MNVLAFGEVLWDVYPDKKTIGGAPLNFAAHLARHGNSVSLLSAIGNDDEGASAVEIMQQWGISVNLVVTLNEKTTGKCLVTLDSNAIPSYNLLRDVAYDYIDCKSSLGAFDVLYFGTLSLRSKQNTDLIKSIIESNNFEEIFVDLNIRQPFSTEEAVRFALGKATIVKISDEELPFVTKALDISTAQDYKAFSRKLSDTYKNLKCIVVTLGAKGAYALDITKGIESECEAVTVKLASTVGAGDSFSAAFLHQYHRVPLDDALRYAARIAGYVVSKYDAVPEYNSKDFS